ncbi:hypothetical protein BU14_0311s0017 [Porphyra umbilicalis]|uniref:Phenylalanyl-tRNA synthetase domain-containing protein n=1 Tax=Porphyra umbilicalis TaxID=2786 RepID=A0A1X6NZT4_PORUM|nr:hypothetical protein BU14_0311s0017 [Porphyra umbilicalis]|eukprot:OSX74077.1 hypothetical protein BU14_0311s0017 [Porphyra umbilicalis]
MALDHFRLVLLSVARARFGPTARQRWVVGVCPCTAPSLELDVWSGGECLELLGAGLLHLKVLEAGGGRPRFSGRSCTRPSWSRRQNCQTSTAVAGDRRAAHGVQSPDAAADCRRFAPHYTEGRCRRRASRICAITVVAERGGAVATCAPGCGGGRGRGPAGGEGWGAASARRVENTTAGHTVPPSAPPQCPCGRLTTKPVRQLQPQLWGPPVGVGPSAGAVPGCATAAAPDLPTPRAGAFTTPHGDAVFLAVGEGGGTAHTAVEALAWDARRGSWVWSALPPVPASRAGSGAAACGADDAAVYVAGSSGRQGGGEPLRLSLQALTPDGRLLRACSSSGAPTAAPTAAAGGVAACFPVDATVTVVGRGAVRLADVGRGDVLAVASVGGGCRRRRAAVVPRRPDRAGGGARGLDRYTRRWGGGRTLRLTPGHLVPVGAPAALVPAAVVAVGDTLYVAVDGPSSAAAAGTNATTTSGGAPAAAAATAAAAAPAVLVPATVTAVAAVTGDGLYDPHVGLGRGERHAEARI